MPVSFSTETLPWHAHPDVWALVLVLGGGWWYAVRRIGPHLNVSGPLATRRQAVTFYAGLAVLWGVSEWPFHDIAEQYLFTFHMLEHMGISLIAVPLLIMGTPAWLARYLLGGPRTVRALRPLLRPLPAFFISNLLFVGLHWPQAVQVMLTSGWAHFLIHGLLFASAFVMWMPVLSPIRELPRLRPPLAMAYLFAHSLLPTIPASFLTFGREPLYPLYAAADRLWCMDVMVDQTVAGLIMKLGGGAILWGTITVMWFRWYSRERQWDALERTLRQT